jgi:hypothetical protein
VSGTGWHHVIRDPVVSPDATMQRILMQNYAEIATNYAE